MRYIVSFVVIFLLLASCKISEKNVIGTYQDGNGKKLILNADRSAQIDIIITANSIEIIKTISGQWNLRYSTLSFIIPDTNFKYVERIYYKVCRKKIKTLSSDSWPVHEKTIYDIYKRVD